MPVEHSFEELIKSPLIKTKFSAPQVRAILVNRARLYDKLTKALARPPHVILASAPPGYGKTVTMAAWLRDSAMRYGWLTLDRGENDPTRFLVYLISALEKISRGFGRGTKSLLSTIQSSSTELVGSSLIRDMSRIAEPFILVFDDYHTIRNAFVHEILQFLIDNQPPLLNIAILTREDPPLALARIKALNLVTELRSGDLAFSVEETKSFFRDSMGLEMEDHLIEALHSRIEGWIAGFQLVALTMQEYRPEKSREVVGDFTGSSRYVVDYFAEEVLEHQSEEIRAFMVKTGVLDRLCPELCDAITGRNDSQVILKKLEDDNYFLVSLDEKRSWFRYHSLFADFLRTQIEKTISSELLRKAVGWFEDNNLIGDAVKHAVLLGDDEETIRLMKKGSRWAFASGQYVTFLRWLRSLAEDAIRRSNELSVCRAWALFLTGQIDLAEESISEIESAVSKAGSDRNKGRCLLLRSWTSFLHSGEMNLESVHSAFRLLGEDDSIFSAFAQLALGFALYAQGEIIAAEETFKKAYYRSSLMGNLTLGMCSLHNLAFVMLVQGRRGEAEDLCMGALKSLEETFGDHPPVADIIYIPLAHSLYLANDLSKAEELANRAAKFTAQFELRYLLLDCAEHTLALIELARGRPEEAFSVIRSYQTMYRVPTTSCTMNALEADISIMMGNVEFAEHWAAKQCIASSSKPDLSGVYDYVTFSKLLMRQNKLMEAESLLEQIVEVTEMSHHVGALLPVLILLAIVFRETGQEEEAKKRMEQAILLAREEGYKRPFLDQWHKIGSLLPSVQNISPHFIRELTDEHRAETVSSTALIQTESDQIEPLSRRERDVLECIAQGFSNAEIAEKLYISVGTVKWHVNNIFGKLDVKSRTHAVIRARELGLL